MGLIENLVQGFANAAGATEASSAIQKKKDERTALSKSELEWNTKQIFDSLKGLQDRKLKLNPVSPTYQQDAAAIDAEMQKAQQTFHDLYHPAKNPGALEHLGGFIKSHLPGPWSKSQPAPSTPAQAKQSIQQRMGELSAAASVPPPEGSGMLKPLPGTKPYKSADGRWYQSMTDGKTVTAVAMPEGYEAPAPHLSDYAQGLRRFVEQEGGDPDNPTAAQEQAYRQTRGAPKKRYAWKNIKGRFVSVELDENNQVKKGTENSEIEPPAYLKERISTSNYHYVDDKGQVHQIQETRTSAPAGSGASIPKTAGDAKKVAKAASPDRVIGFKGSKDYVDTKTSYEAAVDRTSTMDQNLENALKGDQQAMLSLVANHIGMTLGAQRGARITRAVWDEAIASTPWLQKVAAKFSDEGYLSGVTLAPEQMRQMVRLAHEKVQTLKEHIERLDKERQGGGSSTKIVVTPEDMK